ncbi:MULTISPECIES: hypothetical protein [Cetobacterium]|uniref:Protochlamydia outer membrane protein domain-containing protein n=1 Tax=Candidatus Cetobacterium colombiensis TaxID=3073100 RepID=A0ABU4W6T5_9FUSO|nr:hypothetical protein [Candidatus Cetobacterium colombiensis]MDX8334954.1 hypothetical protein [Candidatus Cetobacterium colombiensis]
MDIKKFLCVFLLTHLSSFSIGREILNFYSDEPEKNIYQNYGELENKAGKEYYKWKLGTGSSELIENLTFDYDIERKIDKAYHTKGWENTFSLYKTFSQKEYLGKVWYTDFGSYIKYNVSDIGSDFGENIKETKYSLRYRIRTNFDMGLGGAYLGLDLFASSIDTNIRDGYSSEINFTGSVNLGYGFQNFFTIYNEYLDYANNNGTYLFRIENNFRWTYDLNENFAFLINSEIDSYNYFKNTDQDKSFKFNVGPYILYSQNITREFRVFGQIGILGYNYEKIKTKESKNSESGLYLKIKCGFEYIF